MSHCVPLFRHGLVWCLWSPIRWFGSLIPTLAESGSWLLQKTLADPWSLIQMMQPICRLHSLIFFPHVPNSDASVLVNFTNPSMIWNLISCYILLYRVSLVFPCVFSGLVDNLREFAHQPPQQSIVHLRFLNELLLAPSAALERSTSKQKSKQKTTHLLIIIFIYIY